MYAIAPNIPTERDNEYAKKFEKRFPGYNLLEVIIIYWKLFNRALLLKCKFCYHMHTCLIASIIKYIYYYQ